MHFPFTIYRDIIPSSFMSFIGVGDHESSFSLLPYLNLWIPSQSVCPSGPSVYLSLLKEVKRGRDVGGRVWKITVSVCPSVNRFVLRHQTQGRGVTGSCYLFQPEIRLSVTELLRVSQRCKNIPLVGIEIKEFPYTLGLY